MKKGNKFFYGWWIVFVCAIVSFTMSWTIFGVVLKDLMEQFNSGRGVVSLAQSISVLSGGAAGIVAGKLLTRYRPRTFILWGSVLNGLCFLLLSLSPSLWYFYVFSFIAGVAELKSMLKSH